MHYLNLRRYTLLYLVIVRIFYQSSEILYNIQYRIRNSENPSIL
jgi:hypothetical protein